jgi:hypothetical protein
LAKPNYRHQKKQKEQARKLRQLAKQERRQSARNGAVAVPEPAPDVPLAVEREET